jgi:hypothetical protein
MFASMHDNRLRTLSRPQAERRVLGLRWGLRSGQLRRQAV